MKTLGELIADLRAYLKKSFSVYDKIWIDRQRKLSTEVMFSSIFSHVLAKDSTNSKLMFSSLQSFCDLSVPEFSASTFSKGRKRFPFEFFVDLCQWLYKVSVPHVDMRWFGYSIFAIDSMKFSVPKELEDEGFDSMNDCETYYPQAMLTAAYDLQVGMIYDSIVSQHADERANAYQLFESLPDNSLVVCDRGFPSFEFFYNAQERGIKLLMRMSTANAPEELQEFIDSGAMDEIITLTPSAATESKSLRRGFIPIPVEVRAIRYQINNSEFIVVTTAMEDEITYKDIANLYHARWGIEEEFKLNKVGLQLENFKAKHLQGVLQEVWATQAISCLSRAIAISSSGINNKTPDRKQHSMLGIVKLLKSWFFQLLTNVEIKFQWAIGHFKTGISKTFAKVREGRTYKRRSRRKPSRWTSGTESVSC